MERQEKEHTFVICAYGDSPYLSACVRSLKRQTVSSSILMVTATPSPFLFDLADKEDIPCIVRRDDPGIAADWNFALRQVKTPYATIAHQDDLYRKNYLETAMRRLRGAKKPLLFFSDYGELRGKRIVTKSKLLSIKRMLLAPLRLSFLADNRWTRRRILSLGNPICCPSVTYAMENVPSELFHTAYQTDLDWDAWERLSRLAGSFVYERRVLLLHRIHDRSQTSASIADSVRTTEDREMFGRFWPAPLASLLEKAYQTSEQSNEVNG